MTPQPRVVVTWREVSPHEVRPGDLIRFAVNFGCVRLVLSIESGVVPYVGQGAQPCCQFSLVCFWASGDITLYSKLVDPNCLVQVLTLQPEAP